MTRDKFEATLKKNAYLEIYDFLTHIARSGEPNEISAEWISCIPYGLTFDEMLRNRGLTAKFIKSTGRYFVERRPLPGKR